MAGVCHREAAVESWRVCLQEEQCGKVCVVAKQQESVAIGRLEPRRRKRIPPFLPPRKRGKGLFLCRNGRRRSRGEGLTLTTTVHAPRIPSTGAWSAGTRWCTADEGARFGEGDSLARGDGARGVDPSRSWHCSEHGMDSDTMESMRIAVIDAVLIVVDIGADLAEV